ncbi:MAG: ATP-dependent helicase [Actinobacteria bacterium]|nr:ATP-dependent helicase [Actinomycetota bacterium]
MVQELTDNQVSAAQVISYLGDFEALVSGLPKTLGGSMERFAYTQTFLDEAATNSLLAALAKRFIKLKQERNLVDYADQIALALEAVGEAEVDLGFKFIMLDEYQDTSAIQVRFLSRLFRGRAVMAVGDPNQAIYGFRGASAANLQGFFEDFGLGQTLTLSTCWRSTQQIVQVANLTSSLLSTPLLKQVSLRSIKSGEAVSAYFYQDIVEEAKATASFFATELGSNSGAILMRTKSQMSIFLNALEEQGVAAEVSGLSGLIEIPEVVDLISALRVVADSRSSVELIRLLTSAKWRISLRDVARLGDFAKKLTRVRAEADYSNEVTLVEALDALRFEGAGRNSEISEVGLVRMRQAASLFHNLRSTPSLSITELAWLIVKELEIDIELFAKSAAANPLRHIEQFISKLNEYEASSARPTLGGLIQWLDYALQHDSFELPKSGSKKGVVQIMSVHAAKGLEWDLVWVAQLTQGAFPIEGKDSKGWLVPGKIPFDLRADSATLPRFEFEQAQTQKELNELFTEFKKENRAKALQEERRLAYVAFTRAAKKLVISGSYYKPGAQKPKEPSPFLLELQSAGLVNLDLPEPLPENPSENSQQTHLWPSFPENDALRVMADEVKKAKKPGEITSNELALLFEERDRMRTPNRNWLPHRVSVSSLVRFFEDPEAFLQDQLRPMPPRYSEAASLGTELHSFIEESLNNEIVTEPAEQIAAMVERFTNSRFGGQTARFIEQPIEFQLAGLVVVCKLDAVFESSGEFEIVDWKSGTSPDASKLAARKIQLALYRIALSEWLGIPLERIRASFFYASDGSELSPADLPSKRDLETKLEALRKARQD